MPKPKLQITIRNSHSAIDKLESYRKDSLALDARYQHFISEMIMLRLFSIFEDSVAELAFKIATGATYINGIQPSISTRSGSVAGARGLFLSHGRPKAISNLKWTKAKYIRESVQHVIDTQDPFISSAQRNGNTIEEMRKVRNVLAHNTTSARGDFKKVIRTAYGANVKITPGAYLSSTRRTKRCKLESYLSSTKIILADMASGT